MITFLKIILKSRVLALGYLIIISFLFCIPGSALPTENWFGKIHLDKWIHAGLFFLLFLFFFFSYSLSSRAKMLLLFACILYGFLVEFVQDQYIPNRGWDIWDVVADAAGACLGFLLAGRKKNKPL